MLLLTAVRTLIQKTRYTNSLFVKTFTDSITFRKNIFTFIIKQIHYII